jgi:hypothetical protein
MGMDMDLEIQTEVETEIQMGMGMGMRMAALSSTEDRAATTTGKRIPAATCRGSAAEAAP